MKKLTRILGLLGILFGTARAEPKLQLEALGEFPKTKQAIIRITTLTDLPGKVNAFAFSDFYGKSSDAFYSEVSLGKELHGNLGAKLEWNGGTSMDDVFRFGVNYIPKLHDKLFLDLKLYPLNVKSDGKLQKTGQFSLFGRLDLPKRIYMENWTDLNADYERSSARRINVQSETTLGKNLTNRLSAEVQAAYNVNVPDKLQGRVGLRYNF